MIIYVNISRINGSIKFIILVSYVGYSIKTAITYTNSCI